jgi:hypothetical protein
MAAYQPDGELKNRAGATRTLTGLEIRLLNSGLKPPGKCA